MHAQVLIENNSSCPELKAEHGLSVFVEVDGERWLLDTGQTDKLLYNAAQLNINLSSLNGIIISHGHYDHAGGAAHIVQSMPSPPPVYAHRLASVAKYSVAAGGSMKKPNGWLAVNDVNVSWLGNGVVPLSNHVQVFSLPQDAPANERLTLLRNGVYSPDPFHDEIFTLVSDSQGHNVLYAGCTHHSLELLLPYVFNELKVSHLDAFIGGLHLMGRTQQQIENSLHVSAQYDVRNWYINHCSGEEAVVEWQKKYGPHCHQAWTGDIIEI